MQKEDFQQLLKRQNKVCLFFQRHSTQNNIKSMASVIRNARSLRITGYTIRKKHITVCMESLKKTPKIIMKKIN